MEEQTRQQYLSVMGIGSWELKEPIAVPSDNNEAEVVVDSQEIAKTAAEPAVKEQPMAKQTTPVVANTEHQLTGLKLINSGCQNGLLVVLSEQGKSMQPEARELMSKMLNAIKFLPSESAFAEIGPESTESVIDSQSISGILVFGNDAGIQMVQKLGARKSIEGDHFELNGMPIVATVHPSDIVKEPTLKATAWSDLQLLQKLFNQC